MTDTTLSDGLLDAIWEAYAARGIGPIQVAIGNGVRYQLIDRVRQLRPTRIALLMDASPMRSPEGSLKDWVAQQLAGLDIPVDPVILPASTTADETAVESATAGCAAADVVVTVGSGTISDLGKVAAGDRPHLIVQTAASVNGYSDNESVLLRSGVKRTAHSAYAHTLLADVEIIALAPPELNRSGLVDMISMFTAPADWYLAGQVGMDENWLPDAALLARRYGRQLMAASAGIGDSRPEELELLSRLLTPQRHLDGHGWPDLSVLRDGAHGLAHAGHVGDRAAPAAPAAWSTGGGDYVVVVPPVAAGGRGTRFREVSGGSSAEPIGS